MFHFTVEKYIDRMFSGVRNRKTKSNLALKIDERAHKTRNSEIGQTQSWLTAQLSFSLKTHFTSLFSSLCSVI